MDSVFSNTDTPEDERTYAEGYIDASGNIVQGEAEYYTVGYTSVTPETTIVVRADTPFRFWRVALYDENKNFVRRVVSSSDNIELYKTDAITLDNNEKYLRFSAYIWEHSYVPMVFNSMRVTENTWTSECEVGYIDASGNIVQDSKTFYTVDYADVTPETTISVKAKQQFSGWRVALYDENKNFVRRVVVSTEFAQTNVYETDAITLNSNEKYLRFSANKDTLDATFISSLEVVTHNE
jgi:hypothetical protein